MINEENMKVVVLADDSKWLTVAETNYNGETYKYMMGVTADEEDFTKEVKVMREYMAEDGKHMEFIEDQEMLKILVPLLVPEAKEYIDNPEKLKELGN